MASPLNVIFCAVVALLVWTSIGLPIARRVMPGRALALAAAPALGWAVFCPAAFLLLLAAGLTGPTVAIVVIMSVVAGLAAAAVGHAPAQADGPSLPWWACLLAALVALAPAIAVMPKFVGDGVQLAPVIFDHTKIAMIDEMLRSGLPPGNAFFGEAGKPALFAYYYLWHFGAALLAKLLGVSGWEADAACTWVTAASSLLLMMGLAVHVGGRRSAAAWVAAIGLTASLRPMLDLVAGAATINHLLLPDATLQTWLVQASWAPQHLASATCVLLAVLLLMRLARQPDRVAVILLALAVAAAFDSSTWIGGVTFALAAGPVGLGLLATTAARRRLVFIIGAVVAGLLALLLALPFLHDEYLVTTARAAGSPIDIHAYEVLGDVVPDTIRRLLDLPAYWLLLLVIEFPAFAIAGTIMLWRSVRTTDQRQLAVALGLLAACGLATGWLVESIIANNDLGWRAGLPAILVLTSFAAAGLAQWRGWGRAAAIVGVLAGLPGGLLFIDANAMGQPSQSAALFAKTPDLWAAVRRHAAPTDRVGNNPLAFWDMTAWPIDVSWALLADRPSCYAGWAMGRAFVALPPDEIDRIEALFRRVFAGAGTADDVHQLAARYACQIVVVTAEDGAWQHDLFAGSADYRLVETEANLWRIYVLSADNAR